jgi:hypothetical protein
MSLFATMLWPNPLNLSDMSSRLPLAPSTGRE